MKTINMKSNHATNKMYRKKCKMLEKFIKMMAVFNANQNDLAASINQDVYRVMAETRVLWNKLVECKAAVEPTQLYYKGKCEAKFYKDCCKERRRKKKTSKKSQ